MRRSNGREAAHEKTRYEQHLLTGHDTESGTLCGALATWAGIMLCVYIVGNFCDSSVVESNR
jgi:hypothetical protein